MLARQVGGVQGQLTDEQIILSAAGGGASDTGGVQVATLNTANPTGATVAPTAAANVSAVNPGVLLKMSSPLLWAGLGLGAAWLFTRCGETVSGTKKKSFLVPALIVGAAGVAWWYFSKQSGTASSAQVEGWRASLQAAYAGQTKQLAVLSNADATTLQRWNLLAGIWATAGDPYTIDVNGQPTTVRANSIGAWWESFSNANGF